MISYKYPKIRNSMCFYIIKNLKIALEVQKI